MPLNNDAELIRTKQAFIQLAAFPGFAYLKQYAEAAIRDLEVKALAEDVPSTRDGLIHDARGARKFWRVLTGAIEMTMAVETDVADDPADDFLAVVPER